MLDDGGGASWQVRLGAAPDGTLPNLLSGTAVTTSDAVGIFGDAIAIELPPTTFFRQAGYKYLRIRIENQTTWDGDYRIGFAMWGMSAPLGSPLGVNGPLVQKISEPEWGSALSTIPNVAAVRQPDGTTNKRRKGRAPREIPLSWSGQAGRDSWQNVVRGVIEAASSDTPIVFMENDTFQHDGRISPAGTPSHVCYDPILCYLDGIIQTKHDAYHMYDGRWDANQMRGVVASVSGIVLREIV